MNRQERWHLLFDEGTPMPNAAHLWTQDIIERIWCGEWQDESGLTWRVELAENNEHIQRLLAEIGANQIQSSPDSPLLRLREHESIEGVCVIEFGGLVFCNDQHAGTFERHLYVDENDGSPRLGVTHAELHLEPGFQGKGFLRGWLQETLPRYACAGIDEIFLNTEKSGSWVWANYGFEFQDGYHPTRKDALIDLAAQLVEAFELVKPVLTQGQQEQTLALLSAFGHKAMQNPEDVSLSEISTWQVEGREVGKLLMERTVWYGQIETRKLAERVGADLDPILVPRLGDLDVAPSDTKIPAHAQDREISSSGQTLG